MPGAHSEVNQRSRSGPEAYHLRSIPVISSSIEEWWIGLSDDQEVEVKYPYERHNLAGKVSNHEKKSVMQQFLDFFDANSHRMVDQQEATVPSFFFIPKFTHIDPPKLGEKDHDSKAKSSVVAHSIQLRWKQVGRHGLLLQLVSGSAPIVVKWFFIPTSQIIVTHARD